MLFSITPHGVVAQNTSADFKEDLISSMGTKSDSVLPGNSTGITLTEKAKDYRINKVVPAFGIHVIPSPYGFSKWPDVSKPEVSELITNFSGYQIHSGDFLGSDLDTFYALDDGSKTLLTISTADGSIETIATLTPPAGILSGLTAAEGFFYGIATNCLIQTTLYKLNLTGEIEVLGDIPNALCVVDLAYIPSEKMIYMVDVSHDALFKIDPANPAGAVKVGDGLGFNANYAQGMDYDEVNGILYWAACSPDLTAELRIINTETGGSEKIGDFESSEVTAFGIAPGYINMQHHIHFPMINRH